MHSKCSNKQLLFVVFISIFIQAPVLAGNIYKWTDESGKVHYGDRPKNKTSAEEMAIQNSPNQSSPTNYDHEKSFAELEKMINAYNKKPGTHDEKAEDLIKIKIQLGAACKGLTPAMEQYNRDVKAKGGKSANDNQLVEQKRRLDEWEHNCKRIQQNLQNPK